MSDNNRLLRGGARAVTGLVVIGAAAAAVTLLGTVKLPEVSTKPAAVTVDTTQKAQRTLACAGSFAELGADPEHPSTAVPQGFATVAVSGTGEASKLKRPSGGGDPTVLRADAHETLGAAQIQSVKTENLRGSTASACAEPRNEQWLIGGSTAVGSATTLSLGNPGTVTATVKISLYDGEGPVAAIKTAGVILAPGTQQIISLNGYAPERDRIAVRVSSSGAPVTASLGVGQVSGINPFAVSSVTRQGEPEKHLVIPGIANQSNRKAGPSDAGEGDQFPVIVRAIAPSGDIGKAKVRALDEAGRSTDVGELSLLAGGVAELTIKHWPAGANAMLIDSNLPIVAAVQGSVQHDDDHDNEWFVPAPEILPDAATAVPIVDGGKLVLVNPGAESATVRIADAKEKAKTTEVRLNPGSATEVSAPPAALVTSDRSIHAGVRVLSNGDLAGYPVLPLDPRDGTLTVYSR